MEKVRTFEGVRITLHDETGEGKNGNYNPDDPEDQPMLRFDVYELDEGEWVEVDSASYCTALPATVSEEMMDKALMVLMRELGPGVRAGVSIKKKAERLSWLSPENLDRTA